MEGIKALREQVEKLVALKQGKDPHQPRRMTGQVQASDFMRIILALPVENANWQPIQNSLTGELLFNLGNSILGGDEPLGG
jgi:hypothetical protein